MNNTNNTEIMSNNSEVEDFHSCEIDLRNPEVQLASKEKVEQDHPTTALLTATESTESANFCRICHDFSDNGNEPLLSPCRCKGTLSLVHRSCLETWLAASDSSYCELCGSRYVTVRTLKYPWRVTSVLRWLQSAESRRDARELALDLMTFFVFTPMAVVCTYLGMFAAENYYLYEIEIRPGEMSSTRFVALLAVSMMATLDMAYLSWLMLRTHHHMYQWRSWWRRQCIVKLVLAPNSNSGREQHGTAGLVSGVNSSTSLQ
ncbi:E3 ubiquitin-protein ligase MARCHF2 isoform X2 [Nilaparvata lugens]|uniref:E3 ubiquitin-protein ligase MARCHF2 isoform X2 n=1 Tax=Nilaparvata lugens TaxID=108931 RepID=UPI00193DA1C5|nr:E3 ubiquitin-protein ligase MARCHF2 isoform X2 [Nilaparvata lugens]